MLISPSLNTNNTVGQNIVPLSSYIQSILYFTPKHHFVLSYNTVLQPMTILLLLNHICVFRKSSFSKATPPSSSSTHCINKSVTRKHFVLNNFLKHQPCYRYKLKTLIAPRRIPAVHVPCFQTIWNFIIIPGIHRKLISIFKEASKPLRPKPVLLVTAKVISFECFKRVLLFLFSMD